MPAIESGAPASLWLPTTPASPLDFQVTASIPTRTASSDDEVFFDQTFPSVVWDGVGRILVSSDSAGDTGINIDDGIIIDVTGPDMVTRSLTDFPPPAWPRILDITSLFVSGTSSVRVRLQNAIPSQVGASAVWIVQKVLYPRPFGLASSPDGKTLYVSCAGTGSNGAILAIDVATKAITPIATGLQYPKHGIDVDSSGNLYWATGPASGGSSGVNNPCRKWNGSTVSTLFSDRSMMGMVIKDDKIFVESRDATIRSRWARWSLAGVEELLGPNDPSRGFDQWRGLAVTTDYAISCDADGGEILRYDRTTLDNYVIHSNPLSGSLPTGLHVHSDSEVYVLSQSGRLGRLNPPANSSAAVATGLPLQNTGFGKGPYADIHITSKGKCFVTRGGWSASDASIGPKDEAHGTDVGIYKVQTTITEQGWTIGHIGMG